MYEEEDNGTTASTDGVLELTCISSQELSQCEINTCVHVVSAEEAVRLLNVDDRQAKLLCAIDTDGKIFSIDSGQLEQLVLDKRPVTDSCPIITANEIYSGVFPRRISKIVTIRHAHSWHFADSYVICGLIDRQALPNNEQIRSLAAILRVANDGIVTMAELYKGDPYVLGRRSSCQRVAELADEETLRKAFMWVFGLTEANSDDVNLDDLNNE